jgi:N-sulfoglucosamine sulfohydrolase
MKIRTNSITMFRLFLLSLCIIVIGCSQNESDQTKPNIILIIGDDISWDDLGCYGNTSVHTPNIDKLAAEGLLFNNAFITSSSCSPSRCSIITGRYPHNTGAAELHTPLPAHLKFFPELLRDNGYFSALLAKWHEGESTERAYDTLVTGTDHNGSGGEMQWINILRSRPKDKPFFLWLAPFDAHRPWSSDHMQHHHNPEKIQVPSTLVNDSTTRQDLASYYDEIARLDLYIGNLVSELETQGIADNTILIFLGDNGRAFPGSKTRLYDRGIKTPFIIKWKNGIPDGQKTNALISSIDISATLLECAGISSPETVQGVSFRTLFKMPNQKFRNYIFAEHNWHDYSAYERCVRTDSFLYILNMKPAWDNGGPIDANQSPSAKSLKAALARGELDSLQLDAYIKPRAPEEFYAIGPDPLQYRNLITDPRYREKIRSLKNVLEHWRDETGDSYPANITADWYDRESGDSLPALGQRGEMPGASRQADKINAKGVF